MHRTQDTTSGNSPLSQHKEAAQEAQQTPQEGQHYSLEQPIFRNQSPLRCYAIRNQRQLARSKLLHIWSYVDLIRPSTPMLRVQVPIRLSYCIWAQSVVTTTTTAPSSSAWCVNNTVNNDMGHVDA